MIAYTYDKAVNPYIVANNYEYFDQKYGYKHNRKCIDGKITGSGNCIGYCQCSEHPGFLTSEMCERHECIEKGCYYYIAKPMGRKILRPIENCKPEKILKLARAKTSQMNGLRVVKISKSGTVWIIGYVTISSVYNVDDIAIDLQKELDVQVNFSKLQYDFDTCVKILMAN